MKNIFEKIKEILKSKKFLVILIIILLFIVLVKDSLAQSALKFSELTPEQQKEVMSKLSSNPFSPLVSGISDFFTSTLLKLPIAIADIIADVGGFIISAEGKLLSWAIDLASFTNLGVVQEGWRICRDFANLFFIAILIYIAFATILRLQKGDAKKLLFKVIVMAILINFSLMIGGIIIDFSQVLFRYFIFAPLNNGDKDGIHFSEVLMNAVGVQNIRNTSVPLEATSVLIRLIFVIFFTFLCVIVFGALVFTLLIRNFWLWILLILSPLAWFLGIVPIPMLSKYASEWWRNFIKWCFMAPIMGFFIFLSVGILGSNTSNVSMEQLTKPIDKMESYYDGKIDKSVISFSENENSIFHPKMIIKFLIILSFLIAGLMAGQSLGSGAAKGALGMIDKTKKNAQKWMGRRVANNPVTRGATNWGAKQLNALSTVPVIGKAFKGLAAGTNKKQEELRKEKSKLVKNFTPEQLNGMWKNLSASEKAEAAKKIGHDKLSKEQFKEMQDIYSKQGMSKEQKDMEKAAPHFTSDFKKEAEELSNAKKKFEQKDEGYAKESKPIDDAIDEVEKKQKSSTDVYKANEEKIKKLEKESGFAKQPGIEKAREENKAIGESLKGFDSNLKELRKKKDELIKNREVDQVDFGKAGSAVLERLKGTADISKLNDLSKIIENKDNKFSDLKDAIIYALSQRSFGETSKVMSGVIVKGDDGKKDIDKTFALRREVGINIAENLYLHGGAELSEKMDAVLKMRKIDSSPSALAGGYSMKDIVNGMTTIDLGMKKNILLRAKDKKASDEKLTMLAEEVRKVDDGFGGTKGEKGEKEEVDVEKSKEEKP
jgi:hypothetical protein